VCHGSHGNTMNKFLAILILSVYAFGCADCVLFAFSPLEVLIGPWVQIYGILPIFIAVFSYVFLFPHSSSHAGEVDKTKDTTKPVSQLARIGIVVGLFTIYILVSFLPLSFVKAIPFDKDVIARVVPEQGVIETELGFKVCFQTSKVFFLRGEGRESRVKFIIAQHSRNKASKPAAVPGRGR